MRKIFNFDSTNSNEIKRGQTIVFSLIFTLFIAFASIYLLSVKNKKIIIDSTEDNQNRISISSSLKVEAEKEWVNKSEDEIKLLFKENKNLQKQILDLEERIKTENNKEISKELINQIIEEINDIKKLQYNGVVTYDNIKNGSDIPSNLLNLEFDLINNDLNYDEGYQSLDDYLPAGSYVSAKLISGVDASVGISSQSDPRPVQFRITDYAIAGEYEGRKQKIKKVKGCLVLGAASGDLSSEKVFIRLLKMTCSFKENTTVEFDIKGYASAIGKAGIRGPVISREGNLLVKSFWAGVVEGVGNTGSNALSPTSKTVGNITSYKYNVKDIGLQGLSTGVEASADKLSDYLIKRAEQYQPVISVQGGIDVELVFQSGVNLKQSKNVKDGDKLNKNQRNIQKTNDIQLQNIGNYNTNINTNGSF